MTSFSPSIAALTSMSMATIVIASYSYQWYLSFRRDKEAPIAWSWLPFLGHALELGKAPMKLLTALSQQYDEIFGMVVAGNRMFFITDPHSYHLILKPPKELSFVEFHDSVLVNFAGMSPEATHGKLDDGLTRSQYSKFLYSETALEELTQRMQTSLIALFQELPIEKRVVSLNDFMNRLVFKAAIASLFNPHVAAHPGLYEAFVEFDNALPLAMAGFTVSNNKKAKLARDVLFEACRLNKTASSQLIQKRWEYLDGLTNEERTITANDATALQAIMLWASVGNTMPAAFWTLYYLLSNPSLLQEVKEEVKKVCTNFASLDLKSLSMQDGAIPQSQLNDLLLVDACITEALRLASGSFIMRFVRESCELTLSSGNTYRFRRGDRVGFCPPLTHYDEELYPQPKQFNPHRWINPIDSIEEQRATSLGRKSFTKNGKSLSPTEAFLPFGGGALYCPGRRFARNEIKTFVVYLITFFDFTLQQSSTTTTGKEKEKEEEGPGFDGSRAGVGVFPPVNQVLVSLQRK